MKRVMTIAVTILASATAYCGDVFYWRVDHVTDRTNIRGAGASYFDWADFGDSSNWSLDPETYSNPNGRVPGSDDLLYTLGWMRSSAGVISILEGSRGRFPDSRPTVAQAQVSFIERTSWR